MASCSSSVRVGLLVIAGVPALAGAQPVGSEFRVNTYTTNDQETFGGQLVAADANGSFVVVWNSSYQDGHRRGVFGQRYDGSGAPLGPEFQVNTYTSGEQFVSSVAAAADGTFVVVWLSRDQDGSGYGIFGQRYAGDGAPRGSEFRVNSYTTGHQLDASVASDTSGNSVVVWSSPQDGSGYGVFGQRYDSAGVPQGAEFRVNSFTSNHQYGSSVASDPSGNFVVVWDGAGPGGFGIYGRRFDSQGFPLGEDFQVHTDPGSATRAASVASDAGGNFVVVWHSSGKDGSSYGIFGQRFDSDGARLGEEFQANTYTTDSQARPSVASDADGNFVVVWESSNDQDGNNLGVFAQRYDSTGEPHGQELRINSFTLHAQRLPSVGAIGEKLFAVVWQSDLQDGSGFGVFGQRIANAGDTLPPSVELIQPNGGERLFTGSSYEIRWTASDETGLASFDVFASVDGGGRFAPIAECQDLPASATSCLWLAPGPPTQSALVRVEAADTSGNIGTDDSDGVFSIVPGIASVTLESPNTNVEWRISSVQTIEWTHNLGPNSSVRIEIDRDDDGTFEELIAAAAPADGASSGSFEWIVLGPPSGTCRVRVGWTGNLAVADSSDETFRIKRGLSAEFQVNTYTPRSQQTGFSPGHLIAADASGSFVVVWESDGQDGSGAGVFARRYDSAGTMLGAEFRVNSYTTGTQRSPSVAAAASGSFVVAWERGDGDGFGIFAQRFDGAGGPLGAEFRVNTATTEAQRNPSIATDANGNFVVAWDHDYEDVFGQRFDNAGNPLGAEFRVNSYTSGFQSNPSIAADPDGNFVVTWVSGFQYSGLGVFGQRYDSNGVRRGGEFRVSPIAGRPSVGSDASGNFVVVWDSTGQYSEGEIYGRRYDSAGMPVGPAFQVNSFTTGYQDEATVAVDVTGNFVVAWASLHQDGSYDGIFGQRYDSAGVAQGGEFQINVYTTLSQSSPSVGATRTNEFVAVWTSDHQDGGDEGVFGHRLDFGEGDTIAVLNPNANVKWRIGSRQRIQWTHALGPDAAFRIELDRDGDGAYEELIAAAAPADAARGQFGWTVTGPPSGAARVRVTWTANPGVSDVSDVTFQIRPAGG